MTRNQLTKNFTATLAGPIFTVDENGNITPTGQQRVVRGGSLFIQSTTTYTGYVCAWQQSACQCAAVIADLYGEPHMTANNTYKISATAPVDSDYTLYATASDTGSGPTANATNGDIHIGST